MQFNKTTLGIFDSGVGGLSVLRCIAEEMPDASLIYVADQAHVPYGPRTLEQVRGFSEGIARFLLAKGAQVVVVACNSTSAAALADLRRTFPEVGFVGMEPAVKPAAEKTRSGMVGVLAGAPPGVTRLLNFVVWVNLGWGVLNLLPILPLDGGHIAASVAEMVAGRNGRIAARIFSIVLTAVIGLLALFGGMWWILILGIVLTIANVQGLRAELVRSS